MARIQEERFSILEDVKTVNIGNDMAVTLSIGIGMNGDSYIRNYEYARTAIDMALGRGGDQAAVKSAEGFEFYGGVSRSVEKRSKVKSRIIASAIKDLMAQSESVLIMGHRASDLDALGSAVGMLRFAKLCGKPAAVVVNERQSLAANLIEEFRRAGCGDDFIEPDEAEKCIDKKHAAGDRGYAFEGHFGKSGTVQGGKNRSRYRPPPKCVGHIDDSVVFYHEPYAPAHPSW